jgi:hypothetical protein
MLSAEDFRRIALGMKDASEGAHMDHPDFRVHGRIFATLHPDNKWGMVKLTPDQQRQFTDDAPESFVPEKGAWGLQGCTAVRLDSVDEEILGEALTMAWRNSFDKRPRPRPKVKRTAKPASTSHKR